ncbi:MAG: DUF2764 family protein [Alistipes sp.]|nr:DUF2764 family protein [Alistipes sp.]
MFGNKNYYCLVAGLKEYTLDADTKGFNATEIVAEIMEELSSDDQKLVRLFYSYYDCENIIALRSGRNSFNELGNIAQNELEAELSNPKLLPVGMARVIKAFAVAADEQAEENEYAVGLNLERGFERLLLEAYYEECAHSSSNFLKAWAAFDRTLRNISAAVVARALDRTVDSATVGKGDVVEQLERSSAADFGLRGELPYIDAVIAAVNDESNMVEKEHKIDLIRWEQAVNLAAQSYFDINAILSYLVRVNIVARWAKLDATRGREMFKRILSELDGKELINK